MNIFPIAISVVAGFILGTLFGLFLKGQKRKTTEPKERKKQNISGKTTNEIHNIYVGNISPEVTEKDLRETFEVFGEVQTATIIRDKLKGGHKRFAFVEMAKSDDAATAIKTLDGRDLKGRTLKVKQAHNRGPGNRSSRGKRGKRRPKRR